MIRTAESGWAIVRAWAERVPFDYALAARLGPWKEASIRGKAKREGWIVSDSVPAKPVYDRTKLQRVRNVLWAQVAAAADRAPGDPVAKTDIDALQLQMRALDMLEKSMAPEEEEASDIADTLARINARILELAREFAREIAADGGG